MLLFKLYQQLKIIELIITLFLEETISATQFVILYYDKWEYIRDYFGLEEIRKKASYQKNKKSFDISLSIISSWYISCDAFEGNKDIFNPKNNINENQLKAEIEVKKSNFRKDISLLNNFYD